MALDPSNSRNLEQLALEGLIRCSFGCQDPCQFKSEKTGRGPLTEDWKVSLHKVTICKSLFYSHRHYGAVLIV